MSITITTSPGRRFLESSNETLFDDVEIFPFYFGPLFHLNVNHRVKQRHAAAFDYVDELVDDDMRICAENKESVGTARDV